MRHRVRREAREGLFRKQILHSSDLGIGVGIVVAVGIEINVDPDNRVERAAGRGGSGIRSTYG
jgi:hypothetical protein